MQFTLTLTRSTRGSFGILGTLMDHIGRIAFTAEHAYLINHDWNPKVPPGVYTCVRGMHRLEHMTKDFETFEITGVPHCTGILFHVGSFASDTQGCVLLGHAVNNDKNSFFLHDSGEAFKEFMTYLQGINEFILIVKNNYS